MGFKIIPPPGAPAADLEALGEIERALAAKEAELLVRGAELETEARLREVKLDDAREALQTLAVTSVAREAEAAFLLAMKLVVPPHAVSRLTLQALEVRRKALAMRELALRAENVAIEARRKKLSLLDAEIAALLEKAAALGRGAEAGAIDSRREVEPPRQVDPGSGDAEGLLVPEAGAPRAAETQGPSRPASAPVMNRRVSPRVKVRVEVTMQSESNFFTGFSGDISETGVFVATYQKVLSPGTPVELSLALPGEPAMPISGMVRWVREAGESSRGGYPGLGIAFANVGPREAAAIQRFICGREPLFWAE
jgi:uncharacterized protein (TIGR02266 family)